MKKKILNIFGFVDKKKNWTDLNTNIQLRIYKDIILAIAVLGMGIFVSISSFNWVVVIATIVGVLALLLMAYNKALIFEYETYASLTGECVKIDKPQKTTKFLKNISYGKCVAVVKVEDFFVEIIIPFSSGIIEGTEVTIFAMPNTIMQKNSDYYIISNYLALTINKSLNIK